MTKNTLRQQLSSFFPSHELAQWFDPLIIEFNKEKKQVIVIFPHVFFERWFRNTQQQAFESQVKLLIANAELLYTTAALSLSRRKTTIPLSVVLEGILKMALFVKKSSITQ